MIRLLTLASLLLFATSTLAQKQVYRVGDVLVIANADGSGRVNYPAINAVFFESNAYIGVRVYGPSIVSYNLDPTQFLNKSGIAYGTTVPLAMTAFNNALSLNSTTSAIATGTDANLTTSTSGSIATGALFVSIANTGSAPGTVLGVNLPASATVTFPAISGYTHGAITYDATGTTFLIISTR